MTFKEQAFGSRFFRLNCRDKDRSTVLELMDEEGFSCSRLPDNEFLMFCTQEPFALGSSLAHYFGYIYIQDISSTLPVMLLDPEPDSIVLDMCASPGSKTGQLARVVGQRGLVVANEPNPSRLATLRANLRRLNLLNVITSGYKGQDLSLEGVLFDYVLLDVPCSGWGTLNKNPGAARVWSGEKISSLVRLQRMLLKSAAELLAPGGKLVYSTCTTNPAENEEQIAWARTELPLTCLPDDSFMAGQNSFPHIAVTGPGMFRVNGSREGGQDFFMAALTTSRLSNQSANRYASEPSAVDSGEHIAIDKSLQKPDGGSLWNYSGKVYFVPEKAWNLIRSGLAAKGTAAGKKTGDRFVPAPGMRSFLPEYVSEQDLNLFDIAQIRALHSGQSLNFSTAASLAGLFWKGLRLGWLKAKNGRVLWSGR